MNSGIPPPGFPPPSGAPGEFDYAAGAPPEQPPQHDYEFGGAYNEPTQVFHQSEPSRQPKGMLSTKVHNNSDFDIFPQTKRLEVAKL